MIAITQFSFSLSLVSFITQAWKSIAKEVFGYEADIWVFAGALMCILIPIAWVRDIGKFSFTFLLGNLLILSTVIIVSIVLLIKLKGSGGEFAESIEAINGNEYWAMIGFSCYAYEGIGVVMPIMQACECPEKFDKILFYAILTLTIIYVSFADLCYLILGNNLNHTFITQELDQKSNIVIIL